MNNIVVPIDLTQEEKEVLAIFSTRQFMIVLPTSVGGLAFLIWGGLPFVSGLIDFLVRLLVMILLVGTGLALAFIKLDKYEQYLSEYVTTMIKFWKSQKTYHYW